MRTLSSYSVGVARRRAGGRARPHRQESDGPLDSEPVLIRRTGQRGRRRLARSTVTWRGPVRTRRHVIAALAVMALVAGACTRAEGETEIGAAAATDSEGQTQYGGADSGREDGASRLDQGSFGEL